MRFGLFVAIVFSIIVPTIIVGTIFVNVSVNRFAANKEEEFSINNTALKNNIISSGVISSDIPDNVKALIDNIAREHNCRIQIVNTFYLVQFDTNSDSIGATSISANTMTAMKGEKTREYNKGAEYIEYAIPLVSVSASIDKDRSKRVVGVLCTNYSTKSITAYQKRMTRVGWAADAIALFIALIIAFIVSFVFIDPMKKVEEAVRKISVDEDYEKIENIHTFSEAKETIRELNSVMEDYSNERQKRNEFVSNVSHELKTPITSMKVLADSLIGQSGMPEEMYQEFLKDISAEIDRENKIIVNLLGLINVEKTSNAIQISSVNITEIIESLLKLVKPLADEKNIEIVYECLDNVIADVDEQKISSAIMNLIENAIKYNQVDGRVTVNLNADHQYFYLKVSDTGIGIAEEDQERVFERFFRVDKARARETGGTGLGLAITKEIIKKHDGSIEVFSKEGEGTTFTVRIPLKYINSNTAAVVETKEEVEKPEAVEVREETEKEEAIENSTIDLS